MSNIVGRHVALIGSPSVPHHQRSTNTNCNASCQVALGAEMAASTVEDENEDVTKRNQHVDDVKEPGMTVSFRVQLQHRIR
jgi:Cu/Ag efflux protein CusF